MVQATPADAIITILEAITAKTIGDNVHDRLRVAVAARDLVARLDSPFWQIYSLTGNAAHVTACLRTTVDLGLWEAWRKAGGHEASLTELRDFCQKDCELGLLRRLLIPLAANHILEEAGEDRWRPTPTTLDLGDKDSSAYSCLVYSERQAIPSAQNLPSFLARTGYREPTDLSNCNYMDLTPTQRLNFFDRAATDPELTSSFSGTMRGFAESKVDWTAMYDVDRLLNGYDGQSKLLVDIGGNHGYELMKLLDCRPDVPAGSLVLEDLPETVEAVKDRVDKRIVCTPHDFFKEQPVIGSRAYLLSQVLHNWDDADTQRILQRTAAAMTKGYSRLIVRDVTLPTTGVTRHQASSDLAMMHLLSTADRTESRWKELLRGAGLEVLRVWTHRDSPDYIFEAELASSPEDAAVPATSS